MRNYKIKSETKMKTLMTIILIIVLGFSVNAQENELQESTIRPFQISFVSPLGTNGIECWDITNNFSINILAGYNGGLDGAEFSGFGGILQNDMQGFMGSGFGNIVLGKGTGVQTAGFFNYNQKYFDGVQASGFASIITDSAKAVQISGFGNVTTEQIDGAQLTGFGNYSKGNTIGQASGFANVNNGDLKGFQISGFANVNTERTEGIQIAGFANYTKELKGTQIGVFNYIDSLEKGIPIGVFSIVRNGYRAYEISTSETLYGITSFKTGTEQFYNIISAGVSYRNDKVLWGWGYGIGTMMPLKNDWNLAFELLSYHINEDEWFTDVLNMHNKLQITASKKISQNINVFGGLSWNVNVSETIDNSGNKFNSSVSPWNVFDKTYGNDTNVKMYPGITAGIRF